MRPYLYARIGIGRKKEGRVSSSSSSLSNFFSYIIYTLQSHKHRKQASPQGEKSSTRVPGTLRPCLWVSQSSIACPLVYIYKEKPRVRESRLEERRRRRSPEGAEPERDRRQCKRMPDVIRRRSLLGALGASYTLYGVY